MLDCQEVGEHPAAVGAIPKEYLDAVKHLSADALDEIERGIARYESTGILRGRVLATIKSMNKDQPRRVSRPQMISLE